MTLVNQHRTNSRVNGEEKKDGKDKGKDKDNNDHSDGDLRTLRDKVRKSWGNQQRQQRQLHCHEHQSNRTPKPNFYDNRHSYQTTSEVAITAATSSSQDKFKFKLKNILKEELELERQRIVKESMESKAKSKARLMLLQKDLKKDDALVNTLEQEYQHVKAIHNDSKQFHTNLNATYRDELIRCEVQKRNYEILLQCLQSPTLCKEFTNASQFDMIDVGCTETELIQLQRDLINIQQMLASAAVGLKSLDTQTRTQAIHMKDDAISKFKVINGIEPSNHGSKT